MASSFDVFNMVLKEYESSIKSLEKKVSEYSISIAVLQSRLLPNNLDSSVHLKEDEVFLPGHDRHVLNELLKETIRLRSILNDKYSNEEVAEAQKTIRALRSKITELSVELASKDSELGEHLDDLKSCESEKDALICKLKRDLSKLREESIELATLKEEFRKFLTNRKDDDDELATLREQRTSLSRENDKLSKQLRDGISMNTRWQKYSNQQEAHVGKLVEEKENLLSRNKVLEWLGSEKKDNADLQ
ncbi:protein CROWDED NUCLEI 4-like, partial [Anneissia japonica]|uniref:protein CROWDED NUCLEI 4-like n=1 Tax=Anneissia japonica TaxID=1529436 RepID=UPI00142594A9